MLKKDVVKYKTKKINNHRLDRNVFSNMFIALVGGFSQSKYFQYKIKEAFGKNSNHKLDIFVPQDPMLSIVKGAAYFGLYRDYIQSRISPKTYGIKTTMTLESAREMKIDEKFISENTYICGYTNIKRVNNIFLTFVKKGDEIKIGDVIKHTVSRMHKDQKRVGIYVYSTDKLDSRIIENDSFKNEFGLPLNYHFPKDIDDLEMEVEFYFDDTTIKIGSWSRHDVNNKKIKKIPVVFDN